MEEEYFENRKKAMLAYIEELFKEMEEDMAVSHQEKYAMLEDSFENASDADELKVAFEQWHNEHAENLNFEQTHDEMWDHALSELDE